MWREQGTEQGEGRREGIIRSGDKEVLCARAGTSLESLWPLISSWKSKCTSEGTMVHREPGAQDQSEKGAAVERNC